MMSGGGIIISVFGAAGQPAGRPRSSEDHTEAAAAEEDVEGDAVEEVNAILEGGRWSDGGGVC